MNLKAKVYEQMHKQAAQDDLTARMGLLQERGASEKDVQKDTLVRQLKATIRVSNRRLAAVAAMEQLNAQKAQNKVEKAAQAQANEPAPEKKSTKPKKEKKIREKKSK
ncbi:MAG: hypothetical protein VR64_04770 [Desulfatitalea sp. BRH_c12]|nr:MAG: hypothetical protein VR64_04770 [Desulfatitalea sp. BRH_c12]